MGLAVRGIWHKNSMPFVASAVKQGNQQTTCLYLCQLYDPDLMAFVIDIAARY